MNILFLTNHINVGGITSYLLTLSRQFVKNGHRVFIASAGGEMEQEFSRLGVTHLRIDINTSSEVNPKIYFSLPKLTKFVKDNRITAIHAQTRVTQVLGTLLARFTATELITTCHGFFRPRWFRKLLPCWGKRVIAISPAVQAHLHDDFGVRAENIFLVRHGLDIADYPLAAESEKAKQRHEFGISGSPVIGIVARLAAGKGHDILVHAFSKVLTKYPAANLVIVGEGKQKKALQGLVQEEGLKDNVLFFPVVNQTGKFLAILDVFVLPSLAEGLGLSVMEAQAAGLAVVASRIGGIPALIEEGKTGILVEPNKTDELAEAVLTVLADPARAKAMGLAAREFIRTQCSAGQMAEATLKVYLNGK